VDYDGRGSKLICCLILQSNRHWQTPYCDCGFSNFVKICRRKFFDYIGVLQHELVVYPPSYWEPFFVSFFNLTPNILCHNKAANILLYTTVTWCVSLIRAPCDMQSRCQYYPWLFGWSCLVLKHLAPRILLGNWKKERLTLGSRWMWHQFHDRWLSMEK
jgi:hypothetical protein